MVNRTGAENPRNSDGTGGAVTQSKVNVCSGSVSSNMRVVPLSSATGSPSTSSPVATGIASGGFSVCPGVGRFRCLSVKWYCFASASN